MKPRIFAIAICIISLLASAPHATSEKRHVFDGATVLMLMTCRHPVHYLVFYHDGSRDKDGEYYYDAADVRDPELRNNMRYNIRRDVSVVNFISSRDTAVALMDFLKKSDEKKALGCRYVTSGIIGKIVFCLFEQEKKLPSKYQIVDFYSEDETNWQTILSEFITQEVTSDGKYELVARPIYSIPFMKVSPENIAFWEIGFIEALGGTHPIRSKTQATIPYGIALDLPEELKGNAEKSALYQQKYNDYLQMATDWIQDVENLNIQYGN